MKYLDLLRGQLEQLDEQRNAALAELELIPNKAIDESRSMDDTEQAAFDSVKASVVALDEQRSDLGVRIAELEEIEARTTAISERKELHVARKGDDPTDVLERRDATPGELRSAVMRSLERHELPDDQRGDIDKLLKRHSTDTAWARNLLARSTEVYERAFAKYLAQPATPMWDPDEARAIVVGTNTSGGFLLPTVIDPTLVLTNSGTDNAIRQISRVVTLTGDSNALYVPTSAGVTASWDGELVEVSDDSPEIARTSIPIYKGAAFVMASIEATMDLGVLVDSLRMLFQDAKDRLEGAAFATGNGTTAPTGIFTALDANTNVELTTTTAATVGAVDIHAVYRSLPVRWRSNATWLMNPLWNLGIKTLGSQTSDSIGDIRDPATRGLLGRPVVEAEDAPNTTTTTALDNILVFGDFRNYVIAQKPGSMAVEYIPHIFGNTNSRPIGARGWYAYWRTGADSVNDSAFRLLQDKTSA
jgi:HK97 family phage major capsid protein